MRTIIRSLKRIIKKTSVNLGLLDTFRKPFKEIEFETTSYCNRKCVYCPNSKYERVDSEDGRYMKEAIFNKFQLKIRLTYSR